MSGKFFSLYVQWNLPKGFFFFEFFVKLFKTIDIIKLVDKDNAVFFSYISGSWSNFSSISVHASMTLYWNPKQRKVSTVLLIFVNAMCFVIDH